MWLRYVLYEAGRVFWEWLGNVLLPTMCLVFILFVAVAVVEFAPDVTFFILLQLFGWGVITLVQSFWAWLVKTWAASEKRGGGHG